MVSMRIMEREGKFTTCLTTGFRCLPNYANDMRKQYTLQLELIAKSNLLSSIVSQIIGRDVEIGKLDPNLHKEVAQSNYALS